jgi:hypothetical protein
MHLSAGNRIGRRLATTGQVDGGPNRAHRIQCRAITSQRNPLEPRSGSWRLRYPVSALARCADVRKAYDGLEDEFALLDEVLRARARGGLQK